MSFTQRLKPVKTNSRRSPKVTKPVTSNFMLEQTRFNVFITEFEHNSRRIFISINVHPYEKCMYCLKAGNKKN